MAFATRTQGNDAQILDVFTCLHHKTTLRRRPASCWSRNAELPSEVSRTNISTACLPIIRMHCRNTGAVAARVEFELENLGYEFPRYPRAAGNRAEKWSFCASARRGDGADALPGRISAGASTN